MNKKLRVLCFHPALAPYRLDFFNLLAELVDLEVVFHQKNLHTQKFAQEKLLSAARFRYEYDTFGFDLCGRFLRFGTGRFLRERHPDVVVSYEASPNVFGLIFRKLVFRPKWKLWTSTDDNADQIRKRTGFRRLLRNFVLRYVDGVITPSEDAAKSLREIVGTHVKVSVLPIVHNLEVMRSNATEVFRRGREWRNKEFSLLEQKLLLFVGRLNQVKNLHWLVRQFERLESKCALVIVGEGEEGMALRQLAMDLQVSDRVIFMGHKEGDELYSIMSAADALVLCSHHETYGAVVGEALQWGTPCVVADTCGACCLIQAGSNGFVFTYDDSQSFRQAVSGALQIGHHQESLLTVELSQSVNNLVEDLKP